MGKQWLLFYNGKLCVYVCKEGRRYTCIYVTMVKCSFSSLLSDSRDGREVDVFMFIFLSANLYVHVFLILALTCGIKCLRAYAAYNVRM